jgi:hypothetical protein
LVLQEEEGGGGHPQLNATGQLQVQSIEDGDDCFRILSPEKTKQFTDICSIVETTKNEEFTALLQSYKETNSSANDGVAARVTFDDFARWMKKLDSARILQQRARKQWGRGVHARTSGATWRRLVAPVVHRANARGERPVQPELQRPLEAPLETTRETWKISSGRRLRLRPTRDPQWRGCRARSPPTATSSLEDS